MTREFFWKSVLMFTVGVFPIGLAQALAQEAAPPPALAAAPASPPEAGGDAPAPEKGPPLPFITIEGVGGGGITPMAYLVNPTPLEPGCDFGRPSVALTFINAGRKTLEAVGVTETLFERLELGYSADRLGVGDLEAAIFNNGLPDIATNDVWLQNFNARLLLVKEKEENENFWCLPTPAVTAGVSIKYNANIDDINANLKGALTGIGLHSNTGTDFTLTATKTFAHTLADRPLIASAGLRLSEGADIGFLGFGNTYHATFEGNVAYLPFDWLLLAYEFRQKTDPYGEIPAAKTGGFLIGPENNWQAIDAALILDKHTTFVAGWASLGNLANSNADGTWFLQLKYEF
ncbi:MAG: DUF3034 family protein [Thermoguttaceae bacterium]